ncbi:uncharacterized protein LOC114175140 [Vigna unguiculata]|uniref:uncharacterized protein LOC114175140 n=1 Tax=Vigna unguiculata TaxID=3917 RepID=UPI001016C195|nr:uncharacterized protein LOC114175140 [Vigna unguiculata]
MAESFGANEGGHPSRQPIHASRNFPFSQFILETPLLERWKMLTFDKYDGTTNPDNHMRIFTHQMMFHAVSDPIWCRIFSTSLTGEVLEWFFELSTNNIDSFATLKARFSTQFSPLRSAILTVDNLVNIRQEDGESLRSYLDRYNRMSVKIKDLSMKSPDREEAFSADSLPTTKRKPPPPDADGSKHCQYHRTIGHTTEECHTLRNNIEELIRQEHLKKYIQQDHPQRSPIKNRSPARRQAPARWEKRREPEPERQMREPSRAHRSPRRSRSRSRDKPLRGYINIISGRFAGGGSSSSTRKRHVRALKSVHLVERKVRSMPPITFTDEDFKAPDPDHDDPMVISIEVAEYGIGKVLVDHGSSVNILY